jgi:hypothetical protein
VRNTRRPPLPDQSRRGREHAKQFIGYVVFYKGKPWLGLAGTCTTNRGFLTCAAMRKMNIIGEMKFNYPSNKVVRQTWRNVARRRGLRLRRAYA